MDEICVAKFDVYECRKSDRASALSGAQLNICAAQTPEFPDTIPTIWNNVMVANTLGIKTCMSEHRRLSIDLIYTLEKAKKIV